MEYRTNYGSAFAPRKPERTKCAATVYRGPDAFGHQCSRNARFDPDENGNPTTCKQHSKAEREKRLAAERARFEASMRKFREKAQFREALEKIASGHNDPVALARKVLGWS